MISSLKLLPCAALAALILAGPACADGKDCLGYGTLGDNPTVDAGKVTGAAKTNFVKNESDDKACPADAATCRRKAFLVAGNAVLLSEHLGSFVCATFVNGKGVETGGWLPAAAIAVDPAGAPTPQDWAGTWVREEATIKIKPDAKDGLSIDGDATYGAEDPDRVKRGAVNMGNISAKLAPKGDKLAFAMGDDDKTMPVDKGDETSCKVWMRRVGAYLLVDDNNNCGGMNVTFRGTYARK